MALDLYSILPTQDLVPETTLQAVPTVWGLGTVPFVLLRLIQSGYTASVDTEIDKRII